MEKVLVQRDEHGIVWVTLNRLERRNAVDYDVMEQLDEIIDEVKNTDDDKVLVITGAGEKAFCSGGDLSAFHSLYTKEQAYEMLSKMGAILYKLFTLPKPTIALLNGTAIGGGCEIATSCDFRLAKEDIQFGFVQGQLAITTGWGGASMLLERLPSQVSMKLLMGAKRYGAHEGLAMGFIDSVLPKGDLKASATNWIIEMLCKNKNVLHTYKLAYIAKWEKTNIKQRMFNEIEKCAELWESDDHHDAVNAFLNP